MASYTLQPTSFVFHFLFLQQFSLLPHSTAICYTVLYISIRKWHRCGSPKKYLLTAAAAAIVRLLTEQTTDNISLHGDRWSHTTCR